MAGELIFLTGGTGFLGRHMVPGLLEAGYRLRLLTRPSSRHEWLPDRDLEIVRGDILDSEFLDRAVSGADFVVHAAAHFRFWGDLEIFERVNVLGTTFVAQAARKQRVKKMILYLRSRSSGTRPLPVLLMNSARVIPRTHTRKPS